MLPQAAADTPRSKAPVTALCADVRLHPWPQTVRVQGSLLGDEHAIIGAKVAGRVHEVQFDLGTAVQQGAVLATLEQPDFELQVRQAQAQLDQAYAKLGLQPNQTEQNLNPQTVPSVVQEKAVWDEAKANHARALALTQQHAISTEELQQRQSAAEVAEARYRAALNSVTEERAMLQMRRAALALAQQNLADAVIRAPFAGTILERHVAPGVYLEIGKPVATLVRIDPLRFRAGVPERDALEIAIGQQVRVILAGQREPRIAKISRISPALDLSSRSLTIEADLPNPKAQLPMGMFAEGEIVIAPDAQTLAVPAQAILEFAGVEKVWRVQDGQAAERQVTTGRRTNSLVEILGGLAAGDLIIVDARQGQAGPVTPSKEPAVPRQEQPGLTQQPISPALRN